MHLHHILLKPEEFETYIDRLSLSPFHTKEWRRMLHTCMGYDPLYIVSLHNDKPVLATPFFTDKKALLHFAGTPLPGSMTPYMDPIWLHPCDPDTASEIFAQQYRFLKQQRRFAYIEYRFKDAKRAQELNKSVQLTLTTPQTYYLAISPDRETMWKKIKSRTRTKINKAAKSVEIRAIEDTDEALALIPEFYGMLCDIFAKRDQKPGQPENCYRALIKKMLPERKLLFLHCSVDKETATIGIFPYNHEMIYYLSGASHPIAYKTEANALMHWHVIKFAQENGIAYYDMGGKGIPSIDRFKASFGAQVHDYGKLNYKTVFAKTAEHLYKKVKNIS